MIKPHHRFTSIGSAPTVAAETTALRARRSAPGAIVARLGPPAGLGAMDRIRSSGLQVGLAMGLIFAVFGLVNGNSGLFGLGVVIALAGYFARPTDDE